MSRGDVPRCPNHGEPLQLDFKQKSQRKGSSPCPVSGAMFEWEQSPITGETGNTKDKFGNLLVEKLFTVTGDEEQDEDDDN